MAVNVHSSISQLTPVSPVFLPLYNWKEVSGAIQRLETALERAILQRFGSSGMMFSMWSATGSLEERWQDDSLLLSQVDAHALTNSLREKVVPILTPHFTVPGCDGGMCGRQILVSKSGSIRTIEDLLGRGLALSRRDRAMAHHALKKVLPMPPHGEAAFSSLVQTDGHVAAMRAVTEGQADFCCVDAVAWAMAKAYRSDVADQLLALATTPKLPAASWVTSASRSAAEIECIRDAAISVLSDPAVGAARDALFIGGYSLMNPAEQLLSEDVVAS